MAAHTERMETRLSSEQDALLAKAVRLSGKQKSEFVREAVIAQAQRVIEEISQINLNAEQSERFLAALENPPEPNQSLRAAAQKLEALGLE